jgi:ABC-2 type transport system ATP-binding protein
MKQKINIEKAAVRAEGLGKRYGRGYWALRNSDITVPKGSVSALVGPNGAGKTTLLKLLAGLNRSSEGSVTVLERTPEPTATYLGEIGYLGQEIPLYRQLTAADHVNMGAHLNPTWDNDLALQRLHELGIPLDRPVGRLSGGQRAQVGLALALAKRPHLLLLDEPVAALDPLARVAFLTSLTQAVTDADGELTVIMSSHLLADLERVCDHVVILAAGKTQLCDEIEHVLHTHRLLAGPRHRDTIDGPITVVREVHSAQQTNVLVRLDDPSSLRGTEWDVREPDIEEIVLAYMGQDAQLQTAGGVR